MHPFSVPLILYTVTRSLELIPEDSGHTSWHPVQGVPHHHWAQLLTHSHTLYTLRTILKDANRPAMHVFELVRKPEKSVEACGEQATEPPTLDMRGKHANHIATLTPSSRT